MFHQKKKANKIVTHATNKQNIEVTAAYECDLSFKELDNCNTSKFTFDLTYGAASLNSKVCE